MKYLISQSDALRQQPGQEVSSAQAELPLGGLALAAGAAVMIYRLLWFSNSISSVRFPFTCGSCSSCDWFWFIINSLRFILSVKGIDIIEIDHNAFDIGTTT